MKIISFIEILFCTIYRQFTISTPLNFNIFSLYGISISIQISMCYPPILLHMNQPSSCASWIFIFPIASCFTLLIYFLRRPHDLCNQPLLRKFAFKIIWHLFPYFLLSAFNDCLMMKVILHQKAIKVLVRIHEW